MMMMVDDHVHLGQSKKKKGREKEGMYSSVIVDDNDDDQTKITLTSVRTIGRKIDRLHDTKENERRVKKDQP